MTLTATPIAVSTGRPTVDPANTPAEPERRSNTARAGRSNNGRISWRVGGGLATGAAALWLPWLGLSLPTSPTAWHIPIAMAAVPFVGHGTYGEVVAAVLAVATTSWLRAGMRRTATTRMCGWGLLAIGGVFVAGTRVMGSETLFQLSSDANQTLLFHSQIQGYHRLLVTSFFGFTPDATTTLLLDGLRMGWCLLLVSGYLLIARPSSPRRTRRRRLIAAWAFGVTTAVVATGFGLGIVADLVMADGMTAVQSGQPMRARADLVTAQQMNPQLRDDPQFEIALGQSEVDLGLHTALADFALATKPTTSIDGLPYQVLHYQEALKLEPHNPVIVESFIVALCNAAIGDALPVDEAVAEGIHGSAVLSFTYGHFAYDTGADSATLQFMREAIADSTNQELWSMAYTYMALAEQRIGNPAAFRQDIVAAVATDTQNVNGLAREVAAGLFLPGAP